MLKVTEELCHFLKALGSGGEGGCACAVRMVELGRVRALTHVPGWAGPVARWLTC